MFTNAKNPRWADSSRAAIMLDVQLTGEPEFVGFVASPADCTDYGPMLYNFAINGCFGAVADSDEERTLRGELPVPEGFIIRDGRLASAAALEREAGAELSRRLAAFNSEEAKARAEIDEGYAAERRAKIAALLAVKQQEGWPLSAEWPE